MRPKFLLLALLVLPSIAAEAQHHFRVLHAFGSGNDGAGVWDSVTLDKSGNVYGTTFAGGVHKGGTVFQLTPMPDGRWKETTLHSFPSSTDDGAGPYGGLVFDVEGNLYGTTQSFGKYDGGVAFELKVGRRGWVESVIHNFGGSGDPTCCPWGNLIVDQRGELYGTSYSAFELLHGPKGWTEKILHEFTGTNGDGLGPQAGPIRDAAGNLYGTTAMGGGGPWCAPDGCGVVWELQPSPSDNPAAPTAWTERILYRFGFSRTDGDTPALGQLAMDREGNLYGAAGGGKYKAGIVFKLTPASSHLHLDRRVARDDSLPLYGRCGREFPRRRRNAGRRWQPIRYNDCGRYRQRRGLQIVSGDPWRLEIYSAAYLQWLRRLSA